MERDELLEIAKGHFFAAMRCGYASGEKAVPVSAFSDLPGHKQYVYEDGYFRVVDRYCVSRAGKSAGTTTIFYYDSPVWFMSYGGFYRKEEIPFLKRALTFSYRHNDFNGGRGPSTYRDEPVEPKQQEENPLVYINNMNCSGFESFAGHEEIHAASSPSKILGLHDYWGMALI